MLGMLCEEHKGAKLSSLLIDTISDAGLKSLEPKKHLSGLENLVREDVLEEDVLVKVEARLQELREEAEQNSQNYQTRKQKEKTRNQKQDKQPNISGFF